jgi:acetyl-CoA C-acetyltransferase
MPDRLPVLVGVAQVTERSDDIADKREPLVLMEEAARAALADAGAPGLAARLDSVRVVNVISAMYRDPAGALAERLGLAAGERIYTAVGGNSPQWLVNLTADALAAGEVRAALLVGAEAMHALRIAVKHRLPPPWSQSHETPRMIGDTRNGSHADEWNHGATMPAQIYPLFEVALRAHMGLTPAAHAAHLGRLCASFAAVAADNPYAWFRDRKSAAEIATATPQNRMVAFPYPKFMNAMLEVDQAAAVLMTTAGEARRLGIPEARWVYVHGGAEAVDHWFVKDRVDYHSSPAMALAMRHALAQAGIEPAALDVVDLYSCFPVAAQVAARALGLPVDGSWPLTVTGGLPYFGGPGNNYSMHGIASMVERLRAQPESLGLVSALGWYLTKHAVGVYGQRPPAASWRRDGREGDLAALAAEPHPETVATAEGPARIETYTVVHDREGAPEEAIVIARLADGRRAFANVGPDRDVLRTLEEAEMVGATGRLVATDGGRNRFVLAGG